MTVIEVEVPYMGWAYRVKIRDRSETTVIATIVGKKTTIKAIWDTVRFPDRPFVVGPRRELAPHVKSILTLALEQLIPANHPGGDGRVEQPWVSEMIRRGHFRRPTLRRLPNGNRIIVAACVVNRSLLTPSEAATLDAQVQLWTKVAKAYQYEVKTWAEVQRMLRDGAIQA